MMQVVLVVHLLIVLALIGVVLMQRSEGGGLGIGGGASGGGMSGFLTGRGTANFLTRTTAILAAGFMTTSILLTIMAGGGSQPRSIVDTPLIPSVPAPLQQQPAGEPQAPAAPVQ